jgi:maleate isomerase
VVEALEAETGIPIYDTVATGVWKGMKLVGADPRRIKHWGRLFEEVG